MGVRDRGETYFLLFELGRCISYLKKEIKTHAKKQNQEMYII